MTKPQTRTGRFKQQPRPGMTMIELLVAISILVIIAAILVPQLRIASADRNVREASRMVASLFAQASQRGINDGVAGVLIERNPNITDGAGLAYAGTSMFMLREVPRYIGDDEGAMATNITADSAMIPLPFEQDELDTVRAGDQISFGDQTSKRFLITSVTEQPGTLLLRFRDGPQPSFLAAPTSSSGSSEFIIYRQPRRLVSSRVDLPAGYLVDLRLSGELDVSGTSYFSLDNRAEDQPDVSNSISYLFNGRGAIDRFSFANAATTLQFEQPKQPVYLMVREYSTDETGENIESVLSGELNMWVTVQPVTGAANIVSSVPADLSSLTLNEALREARILGSQGQAAQ